MSSSQTACQFHTSSTKTLTPSAAIQTDTTVVVKCFNVLVTTMIQGFNKIFQAFLGTLLIWALTAAGAAMVYIFSTGCCTARQKVLDASLGFAAGVMIAASFWSLMSPAIEHADNSHYYGDRGEFSWAPVAIGFILGGVFVMLSDLFIPFFTKNHPEFQFAMPVEKNHHTKDENENEKVVVNEEDEKKKVKEREENVEIVVDEEQRRNLKEKEANQKNVATKEKSDDVCVTITGSQRKLPHIPDIHLKLSSISNIQRKISNISDAQRKISEISKKASSEDLEIERIKMENFQSWKRILLLLIAITTQNIPEGLAAGIAFGAIGSSSEATFYNARNLSIGVGIQNLVQAMVISILLHSAGYTPTKAFLYTNICGVVEPVFGVIGALIVTVASLLLPYALAFGAGAMVYVVFDNIIPEANLHGNGRVASWGAMGGFIVMMMLDVGLEYI